LLLSEVKLTLSLGQGGCDMSHLYCGVLLGKLGRPSQLRVP